MSLISRRRGWILGFVFLLSGFQAYGDEPPPADVIEPPAFDQFVVIPLRIHILSATDLPEADCHLSDADIHRVLAKVNGIWHCAGVHWGLESLVREPAVRQERFRVARDLSGGRNLGLFRLLIPDESRRFDGLNVFYIHRFPVNGVWMGEDFAIVQETAKLRPVEGGIDEPLPRVTAHELGHALGLAHRQDRTNLLASGTTGTKLNVREVETARRKATTIRGAKPISEWKTAAKKAIENDDLRLAQKIVTWLAEIPRERTSESRKSGEDREPASEPAPSDEKKGK